MKKFFLVEFLNFTTILFIVFSCDKNPDIKEPYLIKVDSIHAPQVINANTSFEIEFFGTIAGDGCHVFKHFTQTLTNNDIFVEAWGNYMDYSGICPTVMVYLTGHNLTLSLPSSGIYNIKIKQPDNSLLEKGITVN